MGVAHGDVGGAHGLTGEGNGGGGGGGGGVGLGVDRDVGSGAGVRCCLGSNLGYIVGRAGSGVAPGVSIGNTAPTQTPTSLRIHRIVVFVIRLVIVPGSSLPPSGVSGDQALAGDGSLFIGRGGFGGIRSGHHNGGDGGIIGGVLTSKVVFADGCSRCFAHGHGDGLVLGDLDVAGTGALIIPPGIRNKVSGILCGKRRDQPVHIADLVVIVDGFGGITPQADHAACGGGVVVTGDVGAVGFLDTVLRGANGITRGIACLSAQHIVPGIVGVDDLVALFSQEGSGGRGIAGPAGGPVGYRNVGVKGAGGSVAVIVDAIVEGHGGHMGGFDLPGHSVDVGNKIAILAGRDQPCKAAVRHIIGILIAAHIEDGAVLTGEVLNVLVDQSQGKVYRCGIGHIHRAGRVTVSGIWDSHRFHAGQNGIHMAGGVDQRDNANAFLIRIADDGIHLRLGQLICTSVIVCPVACLNPGFDSFTGIGLTVGCDAHVIQQEAQTVIADSQFQMSIVILSKRIDQSLNLVHGKILPAAVKMENAVEGILLQRIALHVILGFAFGQAVGGSGGRIHQDAIFPGFLLGVLLFGGFLGGGLSCCRFLGGLLCHSGGFGRGFGFGGFPGGLLRHSGGFGRGFGFGGFLGGLLCHSGGLRFGGLLHLSNHGSLAFR